MPDPDAKVCVIGIDGGSFDVLDQWIESGDMPNLAALIARGTRTELISTMPPVTGPAWTSMTTGVNPGAHGVFDFFRWSPDRMAAHIVQSTDVPVARFWDLVGDAGRTVGVFNVPVTHPASPVDGFMVTGMLTPQAGPSMTHPPSLNEDLNARGLCTLRQRLGGMISRRTAQQLLQAHVRRERAIMYLLERFRPDLFMCVLSEVDQLQHRFWPYCDKKLGGRDPAIRSLVRRVYRGLDHTIGLLTRFFGDETTFYVVSDHGFGPLDRACLLNYYLAKQGFLSLDWARLRRTEKKVRAMQMGGSLLRALGIYGPIMRLAGRRQRARRRGGERRGGGAVLVLGAVDWERTKACVKSYTDQGIHINVRGRSPKGIVEPGEERERVAQDIIRSLEALKDPATGEPMVTQILRREEVHRGPYVEGAPDIYVVLDNRAVKGVSALGTSLMASSHLNGWHRMEGILAAAGPGIRPGADVYAQITDIAPTVLHTMGVPVPRYMDGRALTSLFEDSFLTQHPVEYSTVSPDAHREGRAAVRTTAEDEAAVRDRLKRLGYL